MSRRRRTLLRTLLAAGALWAAALVAAPAAAQDLVYRPTNPAFGGSPLNYQWLVSSAQAQNAFDDAGRSDFRRDPLEEFEQGLQRQVLGQLSRELLRERFGELDLTKEGRFDFGDFVVEVHPGLDGVQIRVTDILSGDESVVTIPSF